MEEKSGVKSNGLMLVGIGASAGGIDALLRFFEKMPSDSGLAFAVILHTTAGHDSHLAQVLQPKTPMPVTRVEDAALIEANRVYCLPPDKRVMMPAGHFRLDEAEMTNGLTAPIDLFFRTLAHAYKDKAVAVVLSGAGADGSLGLGRIREEGGVSIAQDPSEAEHPAMPRSAIETGFVDFILPVGAMPEKLVSLKQNSERIQLPPAEKPPRNFEEDSLRELLALLRARTRHDFANYKRSTLLRRIERRLQVTEAEDIPAYLEYIRRHPDELQGLLRDLLISVTNFFRDPDAFRRLAMEVVPKLFEGKGGGDQIRVWVSGCATGEEAYSIAMLLSEHADMLAAPPTLQVFATDIDEEALAHGRTGVYPNTIAADVAPERLKRFFLKEGQYYRVKRELRETVLFAPHNILRDPPFSKLDLVSCRNLLIYINRNMQERILEIFHFALKPEGYLFLGSSESAEGLTDLFKAVDKKYRIFKRHDDANNFKPAQPPPVAGEWVARPTILPPLPAAGARPEGFTYGELHYRMLEVFAPPSVLVNAEYDIVHLSEHAGRFLQLSGGEPTRSLLKVAHPDLRLELRSLLITAAQEGHTASTRVLVHYEGMQRYVRVTARPLSAPLAATGFMLVTFEDVDAAPPEAEAAEAAEAADAAPPVTSLEPIVRQLETELERTRDQLRATIEEYETSTEELKASNEELQAMNEELRSASEELETGKEELQSVNEELTTLNLELRDKVDEIGRSNSDLQNLMASTRIATLFLDRTMRLKRYTPSAQELFNIIPGDVGRPLAHITHQLDYPALVEDAERVIRDLHTVEREIMTNDGQHLCARLLPYRTTDDKISGVVLTFLDISDRKQAEKAVARDLRDTQILSGLAAQSLTDGETQALYEQILEAAIALADADAGTIQLLDETTQQLVLLAAKNFPPHLTEHFARADATSNTACGVALLKGERAFLDFDAPGVPDPDGSLRLLLEGGFLSAQSTPLITRAGRLIAVFSTHWRKHYRPTERELRFLDLLARQAADLIEQRQAEDALRASEERLRLVVETAQDYAIMLMDDEGRYTDWNKGAERMFGYTAEEAVGQPVDLIFTPEDRAAGIPRQELQTADKEGRASDERWHMHKDGTRFYVSGVLVSLRHGRGYAKIARDLTGHKQAQDELQRAWEELEKRVEERTGGFGAANSAMRVEVQVRRRAEQERLELLRRIVSTQEDERRRISRELHDQLGQSLTALRLKLEALSEEAGRRSKLHPRIEELTEIARRLDSDVDFLAWELRPTALDDLGLIVALSNYAQEWAKHFGVEVNFHSAGLGDARLAPLVETSLYRIAQEALNNVSKHAAATRVDLLLERRNHHVVLIVEDDGRGFDPEQLNAPAGERVMGLVGMRERAALVGGTVEIESTPGNGTTVFVRAPAEFFPTASGDGEK